MEPLKSIGGAQTRSCAWAKRMSRIWSHYASITADRQSKHGISRVLYYPCTAFNPQGSVRLDTPPACDPVSRQGTKTLDLSIPTNLCPGSEMLRTVAGRSNCWSDAG